MCYEAREVYSMATYKVDLPVDGGPVILLLWIQGFVCISDLYCHGAITPARAATCVAATS